MDFDVADFLQSLFAPVRIVAAPEPAPASALVATIDVVPAPAEPDAPPAAGWVRHQDYRGRWGWESPDLPEWQAWWHWCDYDDLPRPPKGLCGGSSKPTRQDQTGGQGVPRVDTLDLQAERAIQGHLLGLGGA